MHRREESSSGKFSKVFIEEVVPKLGFEHKKREVGNSQLRKSIPGSKDLGTFGALQVILSG